MYFGTGWSLILFSFPIAPELTIDNYYMQFVPQITAATDFFTYMTIAMMVSAAIMIWMEWKTNYKWYPIVVLVGVLAATGLTTEFILPLNEIMREGIKDPVVLQETLDKWMMLNKVRVGLWTVQWTALMLYFATKLYKAQ